MSTLIEKMADQRKMQINEIVKKMQIPGYYKFTMSKRAILDACMKTWTFGFNNGMEEMHSSKKRVRASHMGASMVNELSDGNPVLVQMFTYTYNAGVLTARSLAGIDSHDLPNTGPLHDVRLDA